MDIIFKEREIWSYGILIIFNILKILKTILKKWLLLKIGILIMIECIILANI
jgi:hypothetical protein